VQGSSKPVQQKINQMGTKKGRRRGEEEHRKRME
jgi:hypothetical protein